jgi:hypothetical protein
MPDGTVINAPPDGCGGVGPSNFFGGVAGQTGVGGAAAATGAVSAAMATWGRAADIHARLVADNGMAFDAPGAVGDIRIGAHEMEPWLAYAYYPPVNGVSLAGDVHFDPEFTWVVDDADPTAPFSNVDLQTVALHELGHSLGLDHRFTVAGDVMFPDYTGVKRALSGADKTNIQSIYGAQEHTKDKPTVSEWGMAVLTLLLVTGITIKFAWRRPRDTVE